MVYWMYENMNTNMKMEENMKMEYEYEVYMCSHLVWILHSEKEVKLRNEMGRQLLNPLKVLNH